MASKASGSKPKQKRKSKGCLVKGSKIGHKRSDFRFRAEDGSEWDSKFEAQVFFTLKEQGYNVRRSTPQDSLGYTSTIRGGICTECCSRDVAQERVYTFDLFVDTSNGLERKQDERSGYSLETKGYLRQDRRGLLRHFRKARPDVDLRFIVQRDYPVGKGTITSWITKYLHAPVIVWNGSLPESWKK